MSERELICLDWIDSSASADWAEPDRVANLMPLQRVRSVGWVIHEDDERLILAASHRHDWGQVGDTITIPQVVIEARRRIDPPTSGQITTDLGACPVCGEREAHGISGDDTIPDHVWGGAE